MNKKKKVDLFQHKLFWLVLALIIILPLLSVFTGMFTLDTSSFSPALQNIAFVKEGGFIQLGGKDVKGLEMIQVTFKEDVKDTSIKLEEDETIPFNGAVYSKFRLYSDDQSLAPKVSEVEVYLDLKADELTAWNLNQDNIRLYHNGNELTTKKRDITKQAGHLYYQATAPGLGEFVIGKKAEEKPIEEKIPEPEIEPEEEILPPKLEEGIPPEIEKPAPPEKVSLFQRIINFFKELFS